MSTFMGLAWIDLVPGADAETALGAFHAQLSQMPQRYPEFRLKAGAAAVELPDGRGRIESWSDDDYEQLVELVVRIAEETGLVSHAFVALDHDEYGAEHVFLDAPDGTVRRAYHYYAYPRNEETGAYHTGGGPSALTRIPGIAQQVTSDDPGVLVDGPVSRSTIAARYGVPVAAVDRAATADASAHREIGTVGGPCAHWCDALGLGWPGEGRSALV
jgi:hypothetical protein